jgi:glycogen synthase
VALVAANILWLTERYFPERGGMARSCDRIVSGLRAAGVTVDVLHLRSKGSRFRCEQQRNGRLITLPLGDEPAHALNRIWPALAADHAARPWTHVVAFGGQVALPAAPIYAAWLNLPLITLLRGNDFDTGIFNPRLRPVLQDALQRSAQVCVVSRDKGERITALYPQIVPRWIPNGIDLAAWTPLPAECRRAAEWRAAHVPDGRRVLGMFGHIKPKKGGLFFLKALLASGYAERFHLLLVGELSPEMEQWLALHTAEFSLSREPFVEQADLLWRYAACDLVAITSFYDGMPNVLLEAAALGIPLLAARVGGMADLLADGRHGFLFTPGDPHDCRWAISRAAITDADELQQYGAACRELVADRLDQRRETTEYLAVLRETLAGGKT